MTRDLLSELFAAAAQVKQVHLDRIRALGVLPATIAGLARTQPPFGIAQAESVTPGLYQPGHGPVHIVMPVLDGGTLVDLVAWRTARPDRWWLRTGNGWALNPDDLRDHDRWGTVPTLRATPLDWLRTRASGSVVLDWSAHEIGQLRMHDRIECDGRRVADTLRGALTRTVRMPTIAISAREHRDVA